MVLPQTVHWQRADEDYHACALERTNILTSKDNGIHELCKSAQVINLDSSFSNTLHCSEVHQPFLIQCWGYSRCPFIIHISISTRAQWDLSRKVNLKLEELAHMFFNVKLNFRVGFFWIFFVLTLRHFGNHFGPRKNDFWPFYFFWSFSHWNSHAFTNMHFPTSRSAQIKKLKKTNPT